MIADQQVCSGAPREDLGPENIVAGLIAAIHRHGGPGLRAGRIQLQSSSHRQDGLFDSIPFRETLRDALQPLAGRARGIDIASQAVDEARCDPVSQLFACADPRRLIQQFEGCAAVAGGPFHPRAGRVELEIRRHGEPDLGGVTGRATQVSIERDEGTDLVSDQPRIARRDHQSSLDHCLRGFPSAQGLEGLRLTGVQARVPWIELDRPRELPCSALEVALSPKDIGDRRLHARIGGTEPVGRPEVLQRVIEPALDVVGVVAPGHLDGGAARGVRLGARDRAAGPFEVDVRPRLGVPGEDHCDTRPGVGELGIQLHRPLECRQREGVLNACPPVLPRDPAGMVRGERVQIPGRDDRELARLVRAELGFERFRHAAGDLALDREHVLGGELRVVGLGPQVLVGRRVDELHVDPDLVAGPLHSALEHRLDPELRGDLRNRLLGVTILLDRGARGHPQGIDLGELRQEVVVHADDERFRLGAPGHVVEREHGDRAAAILRAGCHRGRPGGAFGTGLPCPGPLAHEPCPPYEGCDSRERQHARRPARAARGLDDPGDLPGLGVLRLPHPGGGDFERPGEHDGNRESDQDQECGRAQHDVGEGEALGEEIRHLQHDEPGGAVHGHHAEHAPALQFGEESLVSGNLRPGLGHRAKIGDTCP